MPTRPRDYYLALETGRVALDLQIRLLESNRNRAVGLLGIGGLIAAFFGGLTTTRSDGMTRSLWVAAIALGVAALATLWVLSPVPLRFPYDPKGLVGEVERGVDRATMDRDMALALAETFGINMRRLVWLGVAQQIAVGALVVEMAAFAWALRTA